MFMLKKFKETKSLVDKEQRVRCCVHRTVKGDEFTETIGKKLLSLSLMKSSFRPFEEYFVSSIPRWCSGRSFVSNTICFYEIVLAFDDAKSLLKRDGSFAFRPLFAAFFACF